MHLRLRGLRAEDVNCWVIGCYMAKYDLKLSWWRFADLLLKDVN